MTVGYPNRTKSRARITDQTGTVFEKAGYRVVGSTAILRIGGRQVLERTDVVNLERVPPFKGKYNWRLTFENGDTWTIEDLAGGCGCGH